MAQRLETGRPHVSETRLPREPSYEFKRFFAFCLDPLYKTPLLRDTNFRIDLNTLDRLRNSVGNENVDLLERAIVNSRWRSLRGLAAKIGGQTVMTAALSTGSMPPDFYVPLFGAIAVGGTLEELDRDTAYQEVNKAAIPVMQGLVLGYQADMYSLPTSEKQTFVHNISEAIAKGESFARPELTTAVYTLLNVVTLFVTNQALIGASLAVFELAVLVHIQRYLKSAGLQRQLMGGEETRVADAMVKDKVFGTNLAGNMLLSTSDVPSGERLQGSKLEKVAIQLVTQYLLPVLAIYNQGSIALALAQSGQLASHLSPIHVNEREFTEAQAGLKRLKDTLTLIEGNRMSLTTEESWAAFCQEMRGRNLDAVEYDDSTDLIAVIAPFSVRFPGKDKPQLIMKDALKLKVGIYTLSGRSGKGESTFLHALTKQIRTVQEKESVIKLGDHFVRLHDLEPKDIKRFFMYVYPETSESKMSPLALFAEDVFDSPAEFNSYIHDLIEGYKGGKPLKKPEQRAIGYGLQLLTGLKTEDQIKKEVSKSRLPREEKLVILELLPYARIGGAKERLGKKLAQYSFFSEEDFKELNEFGPGKVVNRSLRAKLRIIKTLEEAQKAGTKIIGIDNTIDPISNEDTKIMLSFLEEWCRNHSVSILIASTEPFNKDVILGSSMYQGSIFFNPPYVNTGWETPTMKTTDNEKKMEEEDEE